MDLKKYTPWNWFRKEQEGSGSVPVSRGGGLSPFDQTLSQMHEQIDQMFQNSFRNWPMPTLFGKSLGGGDFGFLRPNLDIKESKDRYTITVEMPGVEKDQIDVKLEGNTLTIGGEKKQETKRDDEDYHFVERSYGSFQRVLNLPEDADVDDLDAQFNKGVLTLKLKKLEQAKKSGRTVEIKQSDGD